ncbi:hypothetical protein ACFHYQ_21590 [Sphaerimonospora cavernae]|uniref:SAF domain-containing protein n=1 Tax=Sphaerimonospora cavernae TaxID=1740611 RepID=A0ABV6U9M9_9ACTN
MRISEKASQDGRGAVSERSGLSGPASRKLPVSPRERRPALAALAVLLILGGALATTLLVMRSGERVSAIRVGQQVGAGQSIPMSALEEVEIADTGIARVLWRDRESVAKGYAAVTLLPGTLLTETMVAESSGDVGPGKALVGLALKPGQLPVGLQVGDVVQVIYVAGADKGTDQGTDGGQRRVLATAARVHSIPTPGRTGGSGLFTVRVDTSAAPAIAQHASNGQVALIKLPGVK